MFHEKAARATAYYNMELFYTFLFDIFVMNASFSGTEIIGVSMIVFGNLYMYFVNSLAENEVDQGFDWYKKDNSLFSKCTISNLINVNKFGK